MTSSSAILNAKKVEGSAAVSSGSVPKDGISSRFLFELLTESFRIHNQQGQKDCIRVKERREEG
jgi:hypothetical protein